MFCGAQGWRRGLVARHRAEQRGRSSGAGAAERLSRQMLALAWTAALRRLGAGVTHNDQRHELVDLRLEGEGLDLFISHGWWRGCCWGVGGALARALSVRVLRSRRGTCDRRKPKVDRSRRPILSANREHGARCGARRIENLLPRSSGEHMRGKSHIGNRDQMRRGAGTCARVVCCLHALARRFN